MTEPPMRSESVLVTRVRQVGGELVSSRSPDVVVVEEPMSIRVDGTLVATTMRTPGHDFELAAGFCFTEGSLGGAPITDVRYSEDPEGQNFNVVIVDTGGRAPIPKPRLGNVSSSCGWCGTEMVDDLYWRLQPLAGTTPIDLDVLHGIPSTVVALQDLFESTGASHGAAAFDPLGEVLLVREDVGRHNAVDKVIGRLLLDDQLPASQLGLFVSGRASVEMVQKAWAAGFGTLVAVSAPTALAIRSAELAGMMLAGFVRGSGFNVYVDARRRTSGNRGS